MTSIIRASIMLDTNYIARNANATECG